MCDIILGVKFVMGVHSVCTIHKNKPQQKFHNFTSQAYMMHPEQGRQYAGEIAQQQISLLNLR
jgi:hypothetical protein